MSTRVSLLLSKDIPRHVSRLVDYVHTKGRIVGQVSRMLSWQGIESTLSAELVCHYTRKVY